ncbi:MULTISPECIES: hypothetical protein [unclassified Methylobacterium]|uniref:hypothetical protein n=1 Tax=unclassified Methylobacterium TaxID=2615210 RepID=UPI0003179F96|nr:MULTISPECIES: hypothetical protein [unclassified Methylobacterium]
MTTLTHRSFARPAAPLAARLRAAAGRLLGLVALVPLALVLRERPAAVLAAIPGGRGQRDLGFGLGRR